MKDRAETFVSGEDVFRGKLLHVRRDVVRLPDGSAGAREYIRHPGAVMIIALFDDGRVLLERQFRYPSRQDFIELPAGKCEKGEDRLETARRELREETGYAAASWARVGLIHPCIGYSDESIEIYVARGLAEGRAKPDAGEFLEVFSLPLEEAVGMVKDGRITDAKTVSGLLWARNFL